ncbi:MAG TPA: sigma-70 family RNA polymerase sigma factor [Pirellulales bacterium]|jgi:RNA polymerase sigma-70 factor (ECF subfamily)|nr:sigma-70 family RNA polymerase sigma factor [Pirellulales bacterium]
MGEITTDDLQQCLDRLRQGDAAARNQLLEFASERFNMLARRMLNQFNRLRTFEQTGDVMQSAMLRLWLALKDVHPTTVREFHGLAATEIRRVLLDLSRKYFGRAKFMTSRGERITKLPENSPAHVKAPIDEIAQSVPHGGVDGPERLADWLELHQFVESLPDDERELVNLLFFLELSQQEVARLLSVDESTVKRRWRRLREELAKQTKDWLP